MVLLCLNARVHAPEAAERVGHEVDVLLRVYARCVGGQHKMADKRIVEALSTWPLAVRHEGPRASLGVLRRAGSGLSEIISRASEIPDATGKTPLVPFHVCSVNGGPELHPAACAGKTDRSKDPAQGLNSWSGVTGRLEFEPRTYGLKDRSCAVPDSSMQVSGCGRSILNRLERPGAATGNATGSSSSISPGSQWIRRWAPPRSESV